MNCRPRRTPGASIKLDLRGQVNRQAEKLFRQKLENGDIALKLITSKNSKLNWALARTLEIEVSEDDLVLYRKNDELPDLIACLHGTEKGKFRFSVLETKGEHLKGNDDTEYKRKLFELLTTRADTAIRAGQLELWEETQGMTFTLLMEDSWKEELAGIGIL